MLFKWEIGEGEIESLGRETEDIDEGFFLGLYVEVLGEDKHICILTTPAFFLTRLPAN